MTNSFLPYENSNSTYPKLATYLAGVSITGNATIDNLTVTGTADLSGATISLTSPGPIGSVTPNTGAFSILSITAPAINGAGSILNQVVTYNAPVSGDIFRPVFWQNNITMPATGTSSGIHERFFVETTANWSGTFTQSGEYNGVHVFARDLNVGSDTASSCVRSGRLGGFEFSGVNQIVNTGSITPFYDAFVNDTTGTVGSYWTYNAGMTNSNTAAGSMTEYVGYLFTGVTGAGTQPTRSYSLLAKSATSLLNSVGPVAIGSLETTLPGCLLQVKGSGNTSATRPIIVKNSSNTNTFLFDDAGNLTATGALQGSAVKNTPVGLGGASTGAFTTLTATTSIASPHFLGSGTAPTVAAGAGAGTSPTVTISNQHDAGFSISVTTGTLPTAAAVIATVTFGAAYANAPTCVFSPTSVLSAALSGTSAVFGTSTTTTWVLNAGAVNLVAATTYTWNVICVQ